VELARSLGLNLHVLEKVSHEEIREYYWSNDIIIDQFKVGSLGMISLEAIACGRPVVTFVSSEYVEYKDFPLKDVGTEEKIVEAVAGSDAKLWEKEYRYLEQNHKPEAVVKKILNIYSSLMY
jgi:glycosyltransferase involved in cell wall biosynthesis